MGAKVHRWLATTAFATGLCLPQAHGQTSPAVNALSDMQARVGDLRAKAQEARQLVQLCEAQLDAADAGLLLPQATLAELGAAAQAAMSTQERCTRVADLSKSLDKQYRSAIELLRLAAADTNDCAARPTTCRAGELSASMNKLLGMGMGPGLGLGNTPAALAAAGPAPDVAQVAKRLEKAQAEVTAAQTAARQALAKADVAIAQAAGSPRGTDDERKSAAVVATSARKSLEAALASNRAAVAARQPANRLSILGMELQECADPNTACPKRLETERTAALTIDELDRQLLVAKMNDETARARALTVEASGLSANAAEQQAIVRFLRAVEANPDAKSLLGGDAAKLSAGKAGKSASIKLVLENSSWAAARGTAFTLTTPAEDGDTRIFSTDGLANATTLRIAQTRRPNAPKWFGDTAWTFQWGGAGSIGYERRKFIDPDTGTKLTTENLRPFALTAFASWAGVGEKAGDRANVHLLSLTAQRSINAGSPTIICPLPASSVSPVPKTLECKSGLFAAPTLEYSREFAYEYRLHTQAIDMSLRAAYNDVTKLKELNVPIYFIRSDGDKGPNPFTAGVNLRWTSADKGSLGVFVGAPLNLLGGTER